MRLGFDAKRAFHNATGLGNYSRDVLRILQARRPEYTYLAYTPRPPHRDAGGAAAIARGPDGIVGRIAPSLWRQTGMVRDLVRDRIDLFHGLSNELPTGIERTGIATVVTIHDVIFERHPELYATVDRSIYRVKFRSAARRARLVIAASDETRRDLVERYGIDPAKIRIVYQVCHPAFRGPRDPAAEAALRARLELPETFVLQVGTIERRKNLLLTARAVAGLDGVHLVAVGRPTAYAREVEAFARESGLRGRLRLLRGLTMTEIATLYRLATVATYPSIVEGFGIPVLEAMTSGTPSVTTRGGVFPEVGGDAAVYVNPADPDELRAVLARLLSDPAERARRREAGLARAERFRDDVIADDLFRVYAEALGR
ncbi:glycosyltransferase family 4 protein [Anaeromyxobacter oryzae]|uniref:Glycosyl transferase family 1 n=1 Tax=Anaeromyxobacter oryzae TaxID=2918170 RepID=A0ABN6MWI2_9BACT|nr:glycosyltransferase family 1 protein [Anaeromyxobacter oryzae]BDG04020.1 glycosyl transferase family 1 [Anaeromyxobacter oryzae]